MEQIRAEVAQGQPAVGQVESAQSAGSPDPRPLDTAEIMARVREEVARRRAANRSGAVGTKLAQATEASAVAADVDRLPRWQPAAPRLPEKSEYVLADFLRFDDADFVDVVYRGLLRRDPDQTGRQGYLDALRSGVISKVEILGLIRFSGEGRRQAVRVDGLLLPYKLHRLRHVRVIGWFLGMGMALARLPRLAFRLQGMEASAARETHELGRLVDRIESDVEKHFANVGGAINALRGDLSQSVAARVEGLRVVAARAGALQTAIESVSDALHASNAERAEQHKSVEMRVAAGENAASAWRQSLHERLAASDSAAAALDQSLRTGDVERLRQQKEISNRLIIHDAALAQLEERARDDRRSLAAMLDRLTVFLDVAARQRVRGGRTGDESEPLPELHYASFEQTFRGNREQIKLRAAHYLGTLSAAGIAPGSDNLVLDLGSGRGEWLEVLAGKGYTCRGLDLDRGMLQASRERGQDVVEADVIEYLCTLEAGSIAAITSMHLVEHLPHPVLLTMLDEALRVLRPGGLLILETPNPENVLVGSCMFYIDPTHLNPIPPLLLQWIVKSRGFEQPEIERLSEHRGSPDLVPVSDTVPGAAQINQMVEWFTAPPDYAVIARKPHNGNSAATDS